LPVDPVAIVRAPACFANCTAKWPTPPAPPEISAAWPAARPPPSNSACHAVSPATGIAAACSWVIASGLRAIALAGEAVSSA